MGKIKIMTDSASDIPVVREKEHDIRVLPFPVTVGEEGFLERVDFTNREFYDILINAPKIPVTSQITSLQFHEEFSKVFEEGYRELIYVSINSKGSATYSNAVMAREKFYKKHPELTDRFRIHLVDSMTYTVGYGYPVVEAAKKAAKGTSSAEILAYLKDWFDSVEVYFAPYTLQFAKKSGRIPTAAAFVGELLGLRPIMAFIGGENKTVEKVRGDKAVIPALLKHAGNSMIPQTPYMFVTSMMDAESAELEKFCKKQFGYEAACSYELGAAITINAGPKTIGLIVKGKNRSMRS